MLLTGCKYTALSLVVAFLCLVTFFAGLFMGTWSGSRMSVRTFRNLFEHQSREQHARAEHGLALPAAYEVKPPDSNTTVHPLEYAGSHDFIAVRDYPLVGNTFKCDVVIQGCSMTMDAATLRIDYPGKLAAMANDIKMQLPVSHIEAWPLYDNNGTFVMIVQYREREADVVEVHVLDSADGCWTRATLGWER